MVRSTRSLIDAVLSKVATKRDAEPLPPVIVHDPAAKGAQDLDDPFLDPKARERAGHLIARAMQSAPAHGSDKTSAKTAAKTAAAKKSR